MCENYMCVIGRMCVDMRMCDWQEEQQNVSLQTINMIHHFSEKAH